MRRMQPSKTSQRIMTREEVRAVDTWAMSEMGIPGVVLMENAGRACADLVKERVAGATQPSVGIICGTGNNGGDGYVIARHLWNDGIDIRVVLCGPRDKVRGDAAVNLTVLERLGLAIQQLDVNASASAARMQRLLAQTDLLVDALFGTGLRGQLNEAWIGLIEAINGMGVPLVAVDIPSGLDCDSGQPLGAAIRAQDTVTFVANKRGFTCTPAQTYIGRVRVASIGIAPNNRAGES